MIIEITIYLELLYSSLEIKLFVSHFVPFSQLYEAWTMTIPI